MVIFDSSIYVDDLRTGRFSDRIAAVGDLVRNSSVVLAELWRGATRSAEERFLNWLVDHYPVLTPTQNNWIESGQVLKRLQANHGFEAKKLRDLHFDVLIALTARSHGARLITSNRVEFELIRKYRNFNLEVW
jgi:predicted nucleic acid-binding protein